MQIYTANADGTNAKLLKIEGVQADDFQWSPDSNRIAFVGRKIEGDTASNYHIHVMNPDGTNHIEITKDQADHFFPAWSPDGKYILYEATTSLGEPDMKFQTYLVQSDGINPQPITKADVDGRPAGWSPDGQLILLLLGPKDAHQIYSINRDGSNLRQLTHNNMDNGDPSWSPNGKKIVFSTGGEVLNGNIYQTTYHLVIMNSDGSEPTAITTGKYTTKSRFSFDLYPKWSPDGQYIAFLSSRDVQDQSDESRDEIYVMKADGTGSFRITYDLSKGDFYHRFMWIKR